MAKTNDRFVCTSPSDMRVILNYLFAEQSKKASGLKIGIFTVFLVVSFITMLESVVGVTPILFVRLGQNTAGAYDFTIKYTDSILRNGDVNFYNVDPFKLNYTEGYSYEPLPVNQVLNKAKPLLSGSQKKHPGLQQIIPLPDPSQYIQSEGDHVLIDGMLPLLNFTWYKDRLAHLPGFNGFTPRTIWPDAIVGSPTQNVTNIMLVIDCAQEVEIGLAPNFNPFILDRNEIMINTAEMDFLNAKIGDEIELSIDMNFFTGATAGKKLSKTKLNAL